MGGTEEKRGNWVIWGEGREWEEGREGKRERQRGSEEEDGREREEGGKGKVWGIHGRGERESIDMNDIRLTCLGVQHRCVCWGE